MRSFDLRGRTVLLTGAANGIGAAAARELAARGARLALLDRDREALRHLTGGLGPHARAFEVDVTDAEAVGGAVTAAADHFERLDAVVANAAVTRLGRVASMPLDEVRESIEANLLGAWWTLRAALPHLTATRGYALAVVSLAAVTRVPGNAAYAASKSALVALLDTLRVEMRGAGVDVGALYLGLVDTDTARQAIAYGGLGVQATSGVRSTPAGLSRPMPVADAAAALIHAVERRARRVVRPRLAAPLVHLPTVAQRLVDRRADRR